MVDLLKRKSTWRSISKTIEAWYKATRGGVRRRGSRRTRARRRRGVPCGRPPLSEPPGGRGKSEPRAGEYGLCLISGPLWCLNRDLVASLIFESPLLMRGTMRRAFSWGVAEFTGPGWYVLIQQRHYEFVFVLKSTKTIEIGTPKNRPSRRAAAPPRAPLQ